MAGFEPIKPKRRDIVNVARVRAQLEQAMRSLGNDLQRRAANYEAPPSLEVVDYQRRTRSAKGNLVKRRGKRRIGYKRTGTLKKSWSQSGPDWVGNDLVVASVSSGNVAPYNVYVRGPRVGPKGKRQAEHMAKRGWQSSDAILAAVWPKYRTRLERILQGKG